MSEPWIIICPTCSRPHRPWRITVLGAARVGGGYRLECANGHPWDEPSFSYGRAEDAKKEHEAAA